MSSVEHREHDLRVFSTEPSLQLGDLRPPTATDATKAAAPVRPRVPREPTVPKIQ